MQFTSEEIELLTSAFKRQSQLRLLAYVNEEYKYEVLGEKLRALTLSDVCELYMNGNSFVAGGTLATIDAVQVFWLVSGKKEDSYKYTKRLLKLYDAELLIESAGNYIDDMFLDCGDFVEDCDDSKEESKPKKKSPPPRYNMTSLIVAELARAYHWSSAEILKMPLPQIWQFLHLARRNENPKYNWRQLTDHINVILRQRKRK